MERTCKIVLADDHTLFRNGLKTLLSGIRNFEVTGEASDGCELLELLGRETPDVVLLDIEMPKMNGIVAAEEALKRWPDLRIITLSTSWETAGQVLFRFQDSSIEFQKTLQLCEGFRTLRSKSGTCIKSRKGIPAYIRRNPVLHYKI